jgi:hypothetical protein
MIRALREIACRGSCAVVVGFQTVLGICIPRSFRQALNRYVNLDQWISFGLLVDERLEFLAIVLK